MLKIVALEKVSSLDEFLAYAKARTHWFIYEYPLYRGYACSISVWFTGLDEKGNIVKFTKFIGDCDGYVYEVRKRKHKAFMLEAKAYIDKAIPHATQGLWEISK